MADGDVAAAEPDDGFTAEERAQFETMRSSEAPTPVDGGAPAADPAGGAADAGVAQPAVDGKVAGDAGAAPAADAGDDDDDEPAAGAAPAAGADPTAKLPRRVSYSKYARAEKQLKDLEAKLSETNKTLSEKDQTQARLDERLKILNDVLFPAKADAAAAPDKDDDPEPDPEADIFGHNQWLKRQLVKTNDTVRKMQEGTQQERAQIQAETEVNTTYLSDAEAFAAKEPNFVPAYQFLMGSRIAELAEYYFGIDASDPNASLTQQQLQRIKGTISGEERQLVEMAIKDGKSPAQRVFALAKARGYRPAAPKAATNGAVAATAEAAGATKAVPGALSAPAAAGAANGNGVSVRAEIERVKAGSEAALSLSSGGGAAPLPLTAERLANMPQDEFNAMMDSKSPEEIRRLMGG